MEKQKEPFISLDSNIVIALLDTNHIMHARVVSRMDELSSGFRNFLVCATVHAELSAYYHQTDLHKFYNQVGIVLDYYMSKEAWDLVAEVHRSHVQNRKKSGNTIAKRPIADAFIGAHAASHAYALYTLNPKDYRGFGTQLTIIT